MPVLYNFSDFLYFLKSSVYIVSYNLLLPSVLFLVPETVSIIEQAHALKPDGEYLFMCYGSTINNDIFYERRKKYCDEVGAPYLSSHKFRFAVASILKAAVVKTEYLQKQLGHSNRAMTEHYIKQLLNLTI